MTTHYQKIQALGNRMAENLTIMGVPSQFDEGGLTLADKILEISSRVTSGIIFYGDKKIAQSEDTANLYALVLDDNIAVSGETVRFHADTTLRTVTINYNGDWIGDDYWVSTSSSDTCWIGGGRGFIQFNSTTIKIFTSSWSPEYSYTGKFHIKDGVLTYTDTNDETQTIDVSGLNLTKAYGATDPFTVDYYWVESTTGSDGVATYAYTCTGSGLREFYATYGTFVSAPYNVWDTLFYDGAVEGNHREDSTTTDLTVTYESDGTILLNEQSTNKQLIFNYSTIDNTVFEFDVIRLNGTPRFYCRNDWYMNTTRFPSTTEWVHVKYILENGNITVLLDGVVNYTGTINTNTGLAFILPSNASLKFKDFKVYSV